MTAALVDLAAATGVALDDTVCAQFDTYRTLLLEWNERVNLTAINTPADVDRRLFLDAITMLPEVDAAVSRRRERGQSDPVRLADVGSGGGFPGLPLKIVRPDLDVTLIEATGKKVTFLRTVIDELGLDGVRALHGRAEDLAQTPEYREQFDIVTARGVAALPVLLELGIPLLRAGGRALFPKGIDLSEELAIARQVAPLVGAKVVAADRLPGDQTTLVVAAKTGTTPAQYPRRAGIPARYPLTLPAAAKPSWQRRRNTGDRPSPTAVGRQTRSGVAS